MFPFRQICPKLAFNECRMLIVPPGNQSSGLPAGRYDIEESYCTEPDCDCRRVMLNVTSATSHTVEAVVSFGFDGNDSMRGPFLDPLNPQGPHAETFLEFVREQILLDSEYVKRLERHYSIARDIVAGRLRSEDAAAAPTLLGPTVLNLGEPPRYEEADSEAAVNSKPFDIHQEVLDEYGEADDGGVAEYIDGLMNQFGDSPEAQSIFDGGQKLGWAATMMDYGFNRLGVAPPKTTLADFQEIVFEILPRKVAVAADRADEIIAELRAFWHFLKRQYELKNAAAIVRDLESGAVERLHDALDDPANFGMAKSFVALGRNAGFDMTTQEGMTEFMLAYNSGFLAERKLGAPPTPPGPTRRELSIFNDDALAAEVGSRADRRAAKRAQRRETKKGRR